MTGRGNRKLAPSSSASWTKTKYQANTRAGSTMEGKYISFRFPAWSVGAPFFFFSPALDIQLIDWLFFFLLPPLVGALLNVTVKGRKWRWPEIKTQYPTGTTCIDAKRAGNPIAQFPALVALHPIEQRAISTSTRKKKWRCFLEKKRNPNTRTLGSLTSVILTSLSPATYC